jgi:hypothetical protein
MTNINRRDGRELALRAFWSEHPLCALFAIANGQWRDGRFEPALSWSVSELIAFTESLPVSIIAGGVHIEARLSA